MQTAPQIPAARIHVESNSTRELVREVSIPLVLITMGALYLMDYAGGPAVRQTWPILLIVGGVAWSMTHFLSR